MNFNPISRFTLELFSVIPSRCINPENSEIICENIPGSGPYVLDKEENDSLVFSKNKFFNSEVDRKFPEKIEFRYSSFDSYLKNGKVLENNEVLYGNEIDLSRSDLSSLKLSHSFINHPTVRFKSLLFMKSDVFEPVNCRRAFAQFFRRAARSVGIDVETSIFTKIMQGYQKFDDLELDNCKPSRSIRWGYFEGSGSKVELELILNEMRSTQEIFEIEEPTIFKNHQDMADAVFSGKVDIVTPSSGFWAADPASDVRMYFTPNMHKVLNHITSDPELQKLLTELENDQSPENFIKVNRYLYEDAKFNVYRHAARFYMTNKNVSLKNLPLGITSPAPYTVLEKLSESN